MKYNNIKQFVSAVLKNPKLLIAGGAIVVGASTIKPAQAQHIFNYTAINPTMEGRGHNIETLHYKSNTFLLNQIGYKYGNDFKNKYIEGKYNLGLNIGTNSVLFNNKAVPDKLFEQMNLALSMSKVLGKDIDLKIGFDKTLNNYKLEGFNIIEASKGSTVKSAFTTGNQKSASAISISFKGGKITSYSGVQEINFVTNNKKPLTAAIGFYSGKRLNKPSDLYWQLRGSMVNTGNGRYVFMPSVGFGADRQTIKNKQLHLNAGILFIKGPNKLVLEGVVNPKKLNESAAFIRYSRNLSTKPKGAIKDKKETTKPRGRIGRRGR